MARGRAPETEHEVIAALSKLFASPRARRVASVGIGDDAAVLSAPVQGLVWTVDAAVEGVHFDRALLSLEAIGARSYHAAVSDIAAMGARPLGALSNIAAPRALAGAPLLCIARGQAQAAKELRCPVIGGNLARASELSITTTVLGIAEAPLTRRGARTGDDVWLVGDVGLAPLGLRALQEKPRRRRGKADAATVAVCVRAFESPRALLREGLGLVGRAHAVIDVSDGLAGDAAHVARASRVRIVFEEGALRDALRPELFHAAQTFGLDPVQVALAGGEDYALLACGPRAQRPRFARRIGRVVRGAGVFLETTTGALVAAGASFEHFTRD